MRPMVCVWLQPAAKVSFVFGTARPANRYWQFGRARRKRVFSLLHRKAIHSCRTAPVREFNSGKLRRAESRFGILTFKKQFFIPPDTTFHFFSLRQSKHELEPMPRANLFRRRKGKCCEE